MSDFRLRLWRRFRVAPGITVNLSNRGVSTSFGVRGAHLTVGRQGVRETVGLPGTGLYFTRQTPYGTPHNGRRIGGGQSTPISHRPSPSGPSLVGVAAGGFLRGIGWVLLACLFLAAIGHILS